MRYDEEFLSADRETTIHMVTWKPTGTIKGVIQIVHGITENIMRYNEMAEYFNNQGYLIVGIDLLGHGLSTNNGKKKMYFGGVGSWEYAVSDIKQCFELTKQEYPNLPYTILGFSLGSFLVRTLFIEYPNICEQAIIIGTGQQASFKISLAQLIVKAEAKKHLDYESTAKINKLTFETYNKKFKPTRTKYDWLCSSTTAIDNYINDPLRGDYITIGLFREMLNGMKFTADINNLKKMNKETKLLFLSGSDDPVGEFTKGVHKAINDYKKAGLTNITYKIYPKLRHDILHEDNRYEIFQDILNWL